MKRERLLIILTSAVLAFTLSFSAVGCLVTAFGLALENGTAVTLVCAGFALFGSLCFSFRRGGIPVLCLLALMLGYLWRKELPWEQAASLLSQLSQVYDRAYGWGVFRPGGWNGAVDYPVGILGALLALLVSRTLCRGKSTTLTIGAVLLPLAACLVVTDTVPEEGCLLALMAGVLILLLTGGVRRDSVLHGCRLAVMVALPVVLALGILFLAIPQEGYVNRSKELQESLLAWVEDAPQMLETPELPGNRVVQGQESETINLTYVGSQILQTYPVMDVTSGQSGTLYLRGQDYDGYSGTGWTASGNRQEVFSLESGVSDTVTVRTRGVKNVLYLPYYPAAEASLVDGAVENTDGLKEYTFHRTALPENWREQVGNGSDGPYAGSFGRYLDLPSQTRTRAAALLTGLLPEGGSNTEKAEAIGAYVRGSAVYDLQTNRMPSGEEDFALWFLEKSDTGYCVHFATAAAVLLRAAGIPARYVSGYMTTVQAGQTATVTAGNAHAWAEYYEPALGAWLVLEATPAIANEEEGETAETVPQTAPGLSEETAPETEQTVSTSAPTLPVETAEPPEAPKPDLHWLAGLAKGLALTALLLGILALQRVLRLRLRRHAQRTGDANTRALALWREAELLAKLLREKPPEGLFTLAQKAKFSQHRLTAEELDRFDVYLTASRRRLEEKPWPLRMICRYLFAVC